jgi:hypothetical protein
MTVLHSPVVGQLSSAPHAISFGLLTIMIERKASTLRSDHKNILSVGFCQQRHAMTHGVGLVVGRGPGLPKVLMVPYRRPLDLFSQHIPASFHVLQHSRKVRRLVANPDRTASDG